MSIGDELVKRRQHLSCNAESDNLERGTEWDVALAVHSPPRLVFVSLVRTLIASLSVYGVLGAGISVYVCAFPCSCLSAFIIESASTNRSKKQDW